MNYWSVNLEKRSVLHDARIPLGTFVVGSDRPKLPNLEAFLRSCHGEGEYLNYEAFKPIWIADEEALAAQSPVFTGEDFKAWKIVPD